VYTDDVNLLDENTYNIDTQSELVVSNCVRKEVNAYKNQVCNHISRTECETELQHADN